MTPNRLLVFVLLTGCVVLFCGNYHLMKVVVREREVLRFPEGRIFFLGKPHYYPETNRYYAAPIRNILDMSKL